MAQHHIIKQQILNISSCEKDHANSIFQEVSRIFNSRIKDETDRIFDKLISEDSLIRIEQLEIDIGSFSYPLSEEQLAQSFIKSFEKELALKLASLENSELIDGNIYVKPKHSVSIKTLIEYYLYTGAIPWWARGNNMADPQIAFDNLFREDINELKLLILDVIKKTEVRKRIIFNFNKQSIKEIVKIIEPAEANYIINYHKTISQIQHKENFIKIESNEFEKELWIFILDFLVINEDSYFNRKNFVRYSLIQMANKFNVAFDKLLFWLTKMDLNKTYFSKKSSALLVLLNELSSELFYTKTLAQKNTLSITEQNLTIEYNNDEKYKLITFYLNSGSFPSNNINLTKYELSIILIHLIDKIPESIKHFLVNNKINKGKLSNRLANNFNDEAIVKTIRLLNSIESELIDNLIKLFLKFEQRTKNIKANEADLKLILWQETLLYLLNDYKTSFDLQLLIKNLISCISNHYKIRLQNLFFVINKEVSEHSEFYFSNYKFKDVIINTIKTEHEENKVSINGSTTYTKYDNIPLLQQHLSENTPYAVKINIKEALQFWLESGSLPPWFKNENNLYAEHIFLQYVTNYPQHSGLLFEYAIIHKKVTHSFFINNSSVFLKVLGYVFDGNKALKYSHLFSNIHIQFKNQAFNQADNFVLLLTAIIETFIETSFKSFNERIFFINYLKSIKTITGLTEVEISKYFLIHLDTQEQVVNNIEIREIISSINVNKQIHSLTKEVKNEFNSTNSEPIIEERITTTTLKIATKNALQFWLEHGNLPFWFQNEKGFSPEDLLIKFISEHTLDSQLLFEYAIIHQKITHSFFIKNSTLFLKVIEHLSYGKKVSQYFHLFNDFHYSLNHSTFNQIDNNTLLSIAIVETLRECRFESFNDELFFINYFNKIKTITNLTNAKIGESFLSQLTIKKEPILYSIIKKNIKLLTENKFNLPVFYETLVTYSDEDVIKLVSNFSFYYSNQTDTIESRVFIFLEYYLLNNKLLNITSAYNKTEFDKIIYKLVLLLFQLNSTKLNEMFSKSNNSVDSMMLIHDVFSEEKSTNTYAIKKMLYEYINKDIVLFINRNAIITAHPELPMNDILQKILNISDDYKKKMLLLNLFKSKSFSYYAANYYKAKNYFIVLEIIGAEKYIDLIKNIIYVFNLVTLDSFEREKMNAFIREFSFSIFSENKNLDVSSKTLINYFLKFLYHKKSWNIVQLAINVNNKTKEMQNTLPNNYLLIFYELQKELVYYKKDIEYTESINKKHLENNRISEKEILTYFENEEKVLLESDSLNKKNNKLLLNEDIYIKNAGLILFHPFLSVFFTRTGLMKDGVFINSEKKLRAPYLLESLINGNKISKEYQIILNKILSGIDAEFPLPHLNELSENELNVAKELISVIIEQWDKMKNTSPENFKASFLQRDGVLSLKNDEWILKIEHRGYDVILQTLPWSISIIKTSWMDKPLIVEWI